MKPPTVIPLVAARMIARVAIGALLVTGLIVGPVAATSALSGVPAAASSATHKAKLVGNVGSAVEVRVKGKFSCSSITGAWTFDISRVQVIGSDGSTPWETSADRYFVFFALADSTTSLQLEIPLSQDRSTGLFDGNTSGTGAGDGLCASGNRLNVEGGDLADSGRSLILGANLS